MRPPLDRWRYCDDAQRRRAFWHEHAEAWRGCDESQAAYCRRYDLSAMSFSHWKRRFERDQLASTVDGERASLIEVQIAAEEPAQASAGVAVEIAPQVRLQLACDFDASALQRAVRALTDAGC